MVGWGVTGAHKLTERKNNDKQWKNKLWTVRDDDSTVG